MYLMLFLFCGLLLLWRLASGHIIMKRILAGFHVLITLVYLIWRIRVIPVNNVHGFLIGILLLGAEFMGIFLFSFLMFLLSGEYRIKKRSLSDFDDKIPTVDVFICTYNEPVSLLEATVLAALNLDYPEDKLSIYLCDDGGREPVRRLAERCGIRYMTRDGNEGVKAGNLNQALKGVLLYSNAMNGSSLCHIIEKFAVTKWQNSLKKC